MRLHLVRVLCICLLGLSSVAAVAQRCTEAKDMDPATRNALEGAARQYFNMAVAGDAAGLRQNSIPDVANNFGGIEQAIRDNQSGLTGGQPVIRSEYLLEAPGNAPIARAEFYCGVFGAYGQTSTSAAFQIPNLPPGRYAVIIMDAQGSRVPYSLSLILQEMGGAWKLAGYYAKMQQAGGHDANWFVQRARDFESKGQNRAAYFYLVKAWELAAPIDFMSTLQRDRLYDEFSKIAPQDLPINGPVNFNVGAKSLKLTTAIMLPVGNDLDLVVRYEVPDVSNTVQAYADNTALIKALLQKYPEFRDAFQGIVARATAPNGQDYGTLLPTTETPVKVAQ